MRPLQNPMPPNQPREYSDEIKRRLKELVQQDIYLKRRPRSSCVGERFGRLVVIRPVGHTAGRKLLVLSHCDCGGAKIGRLDALQAGVKSCGCLEEELKPALKEERRITDLLVRTLRAQAKQNSHNAAHNAANSQTQVQTQPPDIAAITTLVKAANLFGIEPDPRLSHSEAAPLDGDIKARARTRNGDESE